MLAAAATFPAFHCLGHHLPQSRGTHGALPSELSACLDLITNCKVTGRQQEHFSHPMGSGPYDACRSF